MTETPKNGSAAGAGSAPKGSGERPVPPLVKGELRIARDGTWYHEGTPFKRLPMVKLFSTVLRRTEDGGYMLATPVERVEIEVEDAPFVAVEMIEEGEGDERSLKFRTNIDEWVTLDDEHPLRVALDPASGEPSPYILVREGLEALVVRAVFYDLVEKAEERPGPDGATVLAVRSAGSFFPIGTAPAE